MFEHVVIEVGGDAPRSQRVERRGGADAHGLVGLAHEPGVPVGVRVQRDARERATAFAVELGGGDHEPHRGRAPVHDGDPVKRHWSFSLCAPQLIAAASGAQVSVSAAPGSSMVR
jgi:hypothetical protein